MSHLTRHLVDRKRNLEKDLAEVEPQRKWYNERFDELSAELAEIDVAIAALSPMPEAGEGVRYPTAEEQEILRNALFKSAKRVTRHMGEVPGYGVGMAVQTAEDDTIALNATQPATPEQGLGEIENTEGQAERLASEVLNKMGAKLAEALATSDAPAIETRVEDDQIIVREISAEEFYKPAEIDVTPATDPDADFFAKGFAEDAKRKAAEEKSGFRLFGGIGAFGKREVI